MDTLSLLSNITGGMDSFGEAGQMMALASAHKSQAGLYDVAAKGEIAAGDLEARRVAILGEKAVSRQRAMYAKAGVNFTGSPAAMWAESEKNVQLNILNTRLNAAAKANQYGFAALQERIAAGNARTAAWGKAAQGVLKIGTSMALAGGTGGKAGVNINAAGGGGASGVMPAGAGLDTNSLYMR